MAQQYPVKNAAYQLTVNLESQAAPGTFQANPTLAAGDVKISKDGGAFANLATLPTVTPASGKAVLVSLSATEMNCDEVEIVFSDAAGDEWFDLGINIQPQALAPATALGDVQGRIPAALVSGRMDASVGAMASGVLTASAIASNAITAAKIAANALGASQIASGALTAAKFAAGAFDAVWAVATRLLTGGDNITLAKGTGVTGFNDVSAADVNAQADQALADAGVTSARMAHLDTLIARIIGTLAAGTHEPQSGDAFSRLGVAGAGLTALGDARLALLDAAITTRAAAASLSSMQDDVTAIGVLVTAIDDLTKAAGAGDLAAIKLAAERLTAARAELLTDLIAMLEDDGGVKRWTVNALEQAPLGGGGGGGLTQEQVREAVGLAAANLDDQLAAIYARVVLIVPGVEVTVVNPVLANGDLALERGAAYAALDITSDGWPDLTGATDPIMHVRGTTFPLALVTTGVGSQTVRLVLSTPQTLSLPAGTYPFRFDATLAGLVTPFQRGDLVMRAIP